MCKGRGRGPWGDRAHKSHGRHPPGCHTDYQKEMFPFLLAGFRETSLPFLDFLPRSLLLPGTF